MLGFGVSSKDGDFALSASTVGADLSHWKSSSHDLISFLTYIQFEISWGFFVCKNSASILYCCDYISVLTGTRIEITSSAYQSLVRLAKCLAAQIRIINTDICGTMNRVYTYISTLHIQEIQINATLAGCYL